MSHIVVFVHPFYPEVKPAADYEAAKVIYDEFIKNSESPDSDIEGTVYIAEVIDVKSIKVDY